MAKTSKKGSCKRLKKFYGIVTVSEKGQIALPVEIRKDLPIKTGDKFVVVKRMDGHGVNLIEYSVIEKMVTKMGKD